MTTCCQSLWFVLTRCTTCRHSLSLIVIRCHSLYHSLSLIVTRCPIDVSLVCLIINDLVSSNIENYNNNDLYFFEKFAYKKWLV